MPNENISILLVDDEQSLRTAIEENIKGLVLSIPQTSCEASFTFDQCDSAEEALKRISANTPDLLLLDHKLPGISGLDLLERVTVLSPKTLVVMITAYASIEAAVRAVKKGAFDFLAKPFTPDELLAALQKAATRILLSRQAQKLEQEKKQVRFELLRTLGHELKAPIGVVENFLVIMQKRTLGDNVEAYSDIIQRSIRRLEGMRHLIADLLNITRIESGQRKREIAAIDLFEVATQVVEANSSVAQQEEIAITLNCNLKGQLFNADKTEIEILLNNLISNAIKYNRKQGRVDVSISFAAKQNINQLQIEVSDNGIGMSEKEKAKLFGEFVRIKNEKTTHLQGSGLGLSIVKKIVGFYNGSIQVESAPDVGSKFCIMLQEALP